MRTVYKRLFLMVFFISICAWRQALGQEMGDDRTLSPYFVVTGGESEVDQFSLQSTKAEADIAGVIADVRVRQVYKNAGKKPLEAIYVFPASIRAAVYALKMTIGERVIQADIRQREEARQEYEQAREQGRSAALLEQQRPNVFQMNVANILPGDRIEVELRYTELLAPEDGVYEFVYPAVVGPRYSNVTAGEVPQSEQWVHNPYLPEGEAPAYAFDINLNLSAGIPIQEIACNTHETDITYLDQKFAQIDLRPSENKGGNRDFILKYRLEGGGIESGLLLYEGQKENFFLLMMQPPERVKEAEVPPREYIFIVDVSGSMSGFPLGASKALLKDLIGNLRPTDSFNVLLFAGGSSVMSERSLPATRRNIQKAITLIDQQRGGGGTEILPALKRALALSRDERNISRTVVIVTDGYVRVEKEAFDLIRDNLGQANVFTFGIGSSVNRFLIEGMARAGMGEPFVVTGPDQAAAKAERFRKMVSSPVLTHIELDFGDFHAYDVEPPAIPDLMAERPVVVFGKWKGEPKGKIKLSGVSGRGEYEKSLEVSELKPGGWNSALRYLWARKRIELLDDYNRLEKDEGRVKEVTRLGLAYNLLTAYTSFVAIDSEVRANGKVVTIKQPLPLPQGVPNSAAGGQAQTVMYAAAPMQKATGWLGAADAFRAEEIEAAPAVALNRLKIEDIEVHGALSASEAQKTVEANLSSLESCVLGKGPSKITVKLTVGQGGEVEKAEADAGRFGPEDLEECVRKLAQKWRFKKASGKTTIKIILAPDV